MADRTVNVVSTDGSPESAAGLSESLARSLEGTGPALLPVGPGDPAPAPGLTEPVDRGVAVVVTTSGSTGAPKAVLLGAAALRASAAATHARLGGPGRWLLPLPAHHVAGIQVLVRSLLAGAPAEVMDLRDGFRPRGFAAAAARAGARYTSLVPTQLQRLLDDGGAGLEALRGFDAVLVGGAATTAGQLARARDAGVTVVTTYGCSETCGGCVYDGRPLDGVAVSLEPSGRIRLGGAVLAAGYRGARSAAEREAFVDGWFRTRDLGAWDAQGGLEVLGRVDDVVVTGGENVAPARVENALLARPGVREACVVGLPDPEWGQRVVAAVAAEAGAVLDAVALRAAVAGELGRAAPREVAVLDELPLRGVGKPDRDAVRRLLSP